MTMAAAPLRTPLLLVDCATEPDLAVRLSTLGLRRGAHVELVQRTSGGGRVVAVADSRIALDASVARRLRVRPILAAEAR